MQEPEEYTDFFEIDDLEELDPFVEELIQVERDRQSNKLILIPSESIAPPAVRKALGSVFNNVYAEGYPRDEMTMEPEENLRDLADQLIHFRRYANRRFYKGVEYVDILESLAQQRASEIFATEEVPADQIYANVQPLSGTPANLAVYDTFVEPGGTVMGLALDEGGHLSHGSEFNLTGRRYNIVSYSSDPKTGKLNYDRIRELALEHEPDMIIAGYTSFSWAPDWDKFREIADEVGAIVLADISHTAGMAVAGSYPNPIGKADIVMCTTHKTLFGPRGAIILTTDQQKAEWLNQAIFPGAQGGPHPNKFAAMAVAFEIAKTDAFQDLQYQIVDNASHLASALQERGIELAYGGTDTHLLVVDLTKIENETGFTMMGEVVSRILDLVRIVSNKNTIPGDESAAVAHGLRLGTPWITQRGMGKEEMEEIADIIASVLKGIKPFSYIGLTNPMSRGKLDLDLLLEARERVAGLLDDFPPQSKEKIEYPHFYPTSVDPQKQQRPEPEISGFDPSKSGLIRVRGHRPEPFLHQLATRNLLGMEKGEGRTTPMLNADGEVLDLVEVICTSEGPEKDSYLVITGEDTKDRILEWFRGIADGYIIFDRDDIMRKVEGPVVVEDLGTPSSSEDAYLCLGPVMADSFDSAVGVNVNRGTLDSLQIEGTEINYYLSESRSDQAYLWLPSTAESAVEGLDLEDVSSESFSGLPAKEMFEKHEDLFDLSSPYFVGQEPLEDDLTESELPAPPQKEFDFEQFEGESDTTEDQLKRTPLYEKHQELDARMAKFVGWEMPFWYTTVAEEHNAVREAAGLFDVGHMGVFGFYGPNATSFLDLVSSNYARWLNDNEAQYLYLLDPDGQPIDDGILYRLGPERYLMVVNAVNEEKNWEWLTAVNSGEYLIDKDRPWVRPEGQAELLNLKGEEAGERARRDLAFQGPASRPVLKELLPEDECEKLDQMERNDVYELHPDGMEVIVAATGYTGEEVGYELLVHPDDTPRLWDRILEEGEKFGVKPVGLGARDSTRIEAGLPLYGHELAGEHDLIPTEAGFGAYVKLHKPYFIGRRATMEMAEFTDRLDHTVIRFEVKDKSARMVREETPVFDGRGSFVGQVTSCAKVGDRQVGMAHVTKGNHTEEESELQLVPALAGDDEVDLKLETGNRFPPVYEAEVLPRFPESEEDVYPGMRSGE